MRAFARVYRALDETTKTTAKVAALADYFRQASPAEAAWALYFLSGRKPRQIVPARQLSQWACEVADLPPWLFDEAYDAVGDLAETIALLLPRMPSSPAAELPLDQWVEQRLLPIRELEIEARRAAVIQAWGLLDPQGIFVWNKLITGAFRVGVSQQLVTRALAEVSGVAVTALAQRLMGAWSPTPEFFERLISPVSVDGDASRPYPFFLAHPLEGEPAELGDVAGWQAEWKWDGIRAQLVKRAGAVFLWSRGEELVSERYPELVACGSHLPDGTVLDGEILPARDGVILPFQELQRRIGRKNPGKKMLQECPVILMAYDLLEDGGSDLRPLALVDRRRRLEACLALLGQSRIQCSPVLAACHWADLVQLREESRGKGVEGLMLKRRDAPYGVGRPRGDWWKWKVTPYTVDAVLVNAQRGHGKRASLYTDYTFAVWNDGQLVPIAKAYSGLTDAEIRLVDAFVRNNTLERFGPVRSVKPELVFELAFEGLQVSTRHKSGLAARFPRILRWRTDKGPADADTLDRLRALLPKKPPEEPTLFG